MDPFTALGVAANVAQFVDFTGKLISSAREIHNSTDGLLLETAELESATRTILRLNEIVQSSKPVREQRTSLNEVLTKVCGSCDKISTQLVSALDRLKPGARRSKWRSVRQALETIWMRHDVDMLRQRLQVQRQNLDTALLVKIRNQIDDLKDLGFSKYQQAGDIGTQMGHLYGSLSGKVSPWKTQLINEVEKFEPKVPKDPTWLNFQPVFESTDIKPADIHHFSSTVAKAAQTASSEVLRHQILERLSFWDIFDRAHRVADAHLETFQWLFEPSQQTQGRSFYNFSEWLQGNQSVYWITGKPGSGKSTLLKFVCRDPRTRKHLKIWAAGLPLLIASFYFWNSGSYAQMSLIGFLRAILWECLNRRIELVSKVFPRRWRISELLGDDARPWTMPELLEGIDLLGQASTDSFKVCLFVDGLDECNEDHSELINLISRMVFSSNIKVCLSSRPWPVFEDAFGREPNLMVQDLTYTDIIRFATAKLSASHGFQLLQEDQPVYASYLIMNIATKSSGVFLWVALVVESLLQGLSNCDKISDLQKRLDALPGDLEEFYERMFNSIEPFYAEQAAQFFKITRNGQGQLSALEFSFADDDDHTTALSRPCCPIGEAEALRRYEILKKRLNSRCKGFLEIPTIDPTSSTIDTADISHDSNTPPDLGAANIPVIDNVITATNIPDVEMVLDSDATVHQGPIEATLRSGLMLANLKVAYLHRTARDFLESDRIKQKLDEASDPNFNTELCLLRSSLLMLKTIHPEGMALASIWDYVDRCMLAAAGLSDSTDPSYFQLIEEVDPVAAVVLANAGFNPGQGKHWTSITLGSGDEDGFLAFTARYNLQSYVRKNIEKGLSIFTKQKDRPLLEYVINDYRSYASLCERLDDDQSGCKLPSQSLINGLLDGGADPNQSFGGSSTWRKVFKQAQAAVNDLGRGDPHLKTTIMHHWADIVELFLQHNADPRIIRDSPIGSLIRETFSDVPERAKNLERILEKTKRKWRLRGRFIVPQGGPPPTPSFELSTTLLSASFGFRRAQWKRVLK